MSLETQRKFSLVSDAYMRSWASDNEGTEEDLNQWNMGNIKGGIEDSSNVALRP
jgi:hypothetical protein